MRSEQHSSRLDVGSGEASQILVTFDPERLKSYRRVLGGCLLPLQIV
jgi:hypothetical protein